MIITYTSRLVASLLLSMALWWTSSSGATEFYIAPVGNDQDTGTRDRPFATLTRARNAVRELEKNSPVDIILREGVYYLAESLQLDPRDSGTRQAPITWRAAGGEKVVLSGGVPITGKWQKGPGAIWSVAVTGVINGRNFRQLFVEGKRAIRARFPNADEANPFLYALDGGMDHVRIDPKLVKTNWGEAPDAQINIVPNWRFFNQWNTVTGVDQARGRINIADSERHGKIVKDSWFWIEGIREELDQPGEWYLDRAEGRLYYMPSPGVDPNTLVVVAPRLNVLIDAKGEVEKKTHVEYVNFSGLEFRHTTFTLGHIEARVHTDAAIRLENARHCRIENCRIENIGGYAFWLHLDSQHNVIDRNTVRDTGGGGVLFTGARLSYMDDSKLYTPGEVAATVFPILNRVTRNTVKHCGRIRYYGGGVHLDSRPACMAMEPGNYIAHNQFTDLSRNGIFAFRNQGGNIIEYNHIHDAMQTTIDGACIHFATMTHLNAPNYILNNWLHDIWGYEQKPDGHPIRHLANGVFLDWSSSNTTIKDNYVYNAGGKPIKVIWGENWNVKQEGNRSSDTRIVPPFVDELGPEGTATSGIDLESNRLIGRVIHYSDSKLVIRKGDWETRTFAGMVGLFEFHALEVAPQRYAEIIYTLPIPEDGTYQIALLYRPDPRNASNAKIAIHHAEGVAHVRWNMTKGSKLGFAVEVGNYAFRKDRPARVVISNEEADGLVIADSVAFVQVHRK
jgi:hypothetical protein